MTPFYLLANLSMQPPADTHSSGIAIVMRTAILLLLWCVGILAFVLFFVWLWKWKEMSE